MIVFLDISSIIKFIFTISFPAYPFQIYGYKKETATNQTVSFDFVYSFTLSTINPEFISSQAPWPLIFYKDITTLSDYAKMMFCLNELPR